MRRQAHRLEVVAGGRRAHLAEADEALGREVVEAAGEDRQRLARADRVVRGLQRHRRRRAGGDGMDHRPVGATKAPTVCAATTLPSASCRRSAGARRRAGDRARTRRVDAIPPNPQPCVLPTSAGCTSPSSSSGVTPASAKASTVQARLTSAIRSALASRSAGRPKRARSRPSGSCPATRRVKAMRRGRGSARRRAGAPATWRQPDRGEPGREPGRRRRRARLRLVVDRECTSAGSASGASTVRPAASTVSSSRSERTPIRAATASA